MMRARWRALLAIVLAALAFGFLIARREPQPLPPRPANERPTLLLLTSLPLMFGEGLSLKQTGSPAAKAFETRYRLAAISVADPAELARGHLLLMAHPSAQPAEDLVALDKWVRGGGRLLLLADPMLEWPSERPLGDALRPPSMFMDTGLLAHWGLRLLPPEQRGRAIRTVARFKIVTASPGELAGACEISRDRFLAYCRIGNGKATVIADADLLDQARLGAGAAHNFDAMLAELARLEAD
jgi:hypothetical protein